MLEKSKGTTKCDKRTVTNDVGNTQCDDGTVKCEKKVRDTWKHFEQLDPQFTNYQFKLNIK